VSANTLTGLIPTIYEALNVVAAETVGMLPAVSREPKFERAALNATVRSLVTPALSAEDSTSAQTPPGRPFPMSMFPSPNPESFRST